VGFSVPSILPAVPPYGLPPNVIRASYALNLIQTDAFQFATSRRKVLNLFLLAPLPGGGSPITVADCYHLPLATANGDLQIIFYGEAVDVEVVSLTSVVNTTISATSPDIYTGTLSGLGTAPQHLRIYVTDRGGGSLIALFIFEASLTAGQLP